MAEYLGDRVTRRSAAAKLLAGEEILSLVDIQTRSGPCGSTGHTAAETENIRNQMFAGLIFKAWGQLESEAIDAETKGGPLAEAARFWAQHEDDQTFASQGTDPQARITQQLLDNHPEMHPREAAWIGLQGQSSVEDQRILGVLS